MTFDYSAPVPPPNAAATSSQLPLDSDKRPLLGSGNDVFEPENDAEKGKVNAVFAVATKDASFKETATIVTRVATEEEEKPPPLPDSDPPTMQANGRPEMVIATATTGEVISSQTITSRSRTVETTSFSCQANDDGETRVEQKVTIIQSDEDNGEAIDHDEALAQAIQEATAMNPDMTVEKIEIQQD